MFFLDDRAEDIRKVKGITKRIVALDFKNGKPLTETEKELGKELGEFSFKMFSERKLNNKSFTVCNKSFLRRIKINEDGDGIPEKYLLEVNSYFQNNIEAFYELVAQCFISKSAKDYKTDNQLFYICLKSKYSSKDEDLFFVNKRGNFVMFLEDITKINLEDYITDYFGKIDDNLKAQLNELKQNKSATHEELQKSITKLFNDYNNIVMDEHDFQEGAISFFDFLGWKGLWQSKDRDHLNAVSKLIESFRKKLKESTAKLLPYSNGIEISKLISISDTIALFTPKISTVNECQLLELHAELARFILECSVMNQYPIRGAIAYGEYNVLNNVMIGPGVDECASWHEKGDWIGVHFTPSAQFVLVNNCSNLTNNIIKSENKLPLKSGVPQVDYCVKWYVKKEDFQRLLKNVKALLPEIASKYMNTYNFLYIISGKEDSYGQNGISE